MTTQEITFRLCTLADLSQVQKFAEELYADDKHLQDNHPVVKLTFDEFQLRPDKGRIIVFQSEGKVVGYAILVFFWSNEYKGNIIEIDELLVDSSCRSRGVGKQFLAWMEKEFATMSVGLSLQVAHMNDRAHKLYESQGFKLSRNKHMIKVYPHKPVLV